MGTSHAQREWAHHFVPPGHQVAAKREASCAASHRPQEQPLLHDYSRDEPHPGRHAVLGQRGMVAGADDWIGTARGHVSAWAWAWAGVAGGVSQVIMVNFE